jgi:hypothetical protein
MPKVRSKISHGIAQAMKRLKAEFYDWKSWFKLYPGIGSSWLSYSCKYGRK